MVCVRLRGLCIRGVVLGCRDLFSSPGRGKGRLLYIYIIVLSFGSQEAYALLNPAASTPPPPLLALFIGCGLFSHLSYMHVKLFGTLARV